MSNKIIVVGIKDNEKVKSYEANNKEEKQKYISLLKKESFQEIRIYDNII